MDAEHVKTKTKDKMSVNGDETLPQVTNCCSSPCTCGFSVTNPCGIGRVGTGNGWGLAPSVAALYEAGQPIIPRSGSFAFNSTGAWQPLGTRSCGLGPRDRICPPGMHSCLVGQPNTWACLPNNVPCAVGINSFYHGFYINDIYDTTRCTPYGGGNRRPRGPYHL